jgi:hypothetical protein
VDGISLPSIMTTESNLVCLIKGHRPGNDTYNRYYHEESESCEYCKKPIRLSATFNTWELYKR